ncbi:MAG TPA: F0F1 ATP synthase subunit A [Thermoanaerobaculia bacterium]|nr:F0F1 ATP synthase subunit A [Thermoanaerobaculia bacterium]HMF08335.1 F0F1 ATP synthase subunit A [Thermoanaerobaculia bacterium]
MEHHSILYGPINGLLIRLLGEPPVEKMSPGAAAFWFPDGKEAWIPDAAIMTLLLLFLFAVFFPLAARRYRREKPGGVQNFLEMIVEGIRSLIEDVIGHGASKKYLNIIGAFAVFIFAGNLFGLFFFLQPPTGVLSTTVALAVISFVYFNWQGIKEQGLLNYLKHFMGPVLWLAPLFFIIEMIGNFARILSLSLRLFMNIYGEHTATGIFAGLLPIVVPWPLMALGLFTALLQSFIFVTLTSVYISLATAHEEH